jgi:hypothetical protein
MILLLIWFNLIEENDEMRLYRKIKLVVFSKEENLPVAIKEDFFSILYALHCVQKSHVGTCLRTLSSFTLNYKSNELIVSIEHIYARIN